MPRRRGHNVAKLWPAEYAAWRAARARCRDANHPAFAHYGGRGISVAPEWENFHRFLADMGPRPSRGYSLDRIDNNGGYTPTNCRWATWREQHNNRRDNVRVEWDGKHLTIAEWADVTGLTVDALGQRIRKGWTVQRALTEALRPY